jgi:rod shape-determining protein MreD
MWIVAWSWKRTYWQGAIAGVVLGLIQDSMTAPYPSHVISLVLVGVLTVYIQKQRWLSDGILWVSLLVFFMAIVAETVTALQYLLEEVYTSWQGSTAPNINTIWHTYQEVSLYSSLLSAVWMPVLYYPLNMWWQKLHKIQRSL